MACLQRVVRACPEGFLNRDTHPQEISRDRAAAWWLYTYDITAISDWQEAHGGPEWLCLLVNQHWRMDTACRGTIVAAENLHGDRT